MYIAMEIADSKLALVLPHHDPYQIKAVRLRVDGWDQKNSKIDKLAITETQRTFGRQVWVVFARSRTTWSMLYIPDEFWAVAPKINYWARSARSPHPPRFG